MSIFNSLTVNTILALAIIKTIWFKTLATALIAASFTQWLNNHLTKERERENKQKEAFKEFYDKIVPEIYDYFSIETDFRKGHDLKANVNSRKVKKDILETIPENMLHITSEIHTAYRRVMKSRYFDDNAGFFVDVLEITLFHVIVEEFIKLAEVNNYRDTKVDISNACLLLIWKNIIINCESYEMAYTAISKNYYFDSKKLNKETLQQLKRLDELEQNSEERKTLFKEILTDLISNANMDGDKRGEFLKPFFENNIEVNNSRFVTVLENLEEDHGNLTVEERTTFRDRLVVELYDKKYNLNESPKYSFIYSKRRFDSLPNEFKNVINYWKDKEILRMEPIGEELEIMLTAKGEDYYEKEVYLSDI